MKFLFVYISFLFFIYGVGYFGYYLLLRKYLKLSHLQKVFFVLLSGYILTISIYSIYLTSFKTVNLVFLMLAFFSYYEIRKSPKRDSKVGKSIFFFCLVSSLTLFAFSYFSIADDSGFLKFYYNNSDYILYGKIAKFLLNGNENGYNILNELDVFYQSPEPYHYFDLYGATLVGQVFGVNTYLGLRLVIYPVFYLMILLGTLSLLKKYTLIKIISVLLLLVVGGVTFCFYSSFEFLSSLNNFSSNLFDPYLLKLSYFYLFFLTAYLFYRIKKIELAVLSLLCLPVANIIALPAVVISIIVTIIFIRYNNQISRSQLIRILIYTSLTVITISLFYLIFSNNKVGFAGSEIDDPYNLLKMAFIYLDIKTRINIILGGLIAILILYFPFIILLVIKQITNPRHLFSGPTIFIVCIVISSLLSWSILFRELNSNQIFYNLSIPIINIALITFITNNYINIESLRWRREIAYYPILGLLLIALIIINNISSVYNRVHQQRVEINDQEYLRKIQSFTVPNSLVGSIKSKSQMESIFQKYNAVYPLGDYLFMMNKGLSSINMGDLKTPIDITSEINKERSIKAISNGIFLRFSQKKENLNKNEVCLMIDFINKYNINYLIFGENSEIPDSIMNLTENSFWDSISGDCFLVLK